MSPPAWTSLPIPPLEVVTEPGFEFPVESVFFFFKQKILCIYHQASSLIQKHWNKETNRFPSNAHLAVQTVVMFSQRYGKMRVTLIQHLYVCQLRCATPYRPSSVLLPCLLLELYLILLRFFIQSVQRWDSSAFVSWAWIAWSWKSCEKTWWEQREVRASHDGEKERAPLLLLMVPTAWSPSSGCQKH